MNAREALYLIFEDIDRWEHKNEFQATSDDTLRHRTRKLQLAKTYRARGDMEGVKRNVRAAVKWHRAHMEALKEKEKLEEHKYP